MTQVLGKYKHWTFWHIYFHKTIILGNQNQGLAFEIISARISDSNEEKRHVIYTLQVRYIVSNNDCNPIVIERRYTHFLTLYTALKQAFPLLMNNVSFPKKKLIGNFDNQLISARSTEFESLLKHVSHNSKLKSSEALLTFLQEVEVIEAKQLMEKKYFPLSLHLLENIFKLLNKVYTDRSPAVLLALCRLLACNISIPGSPSSIQWADIALHRYDGVSDSDLLELYVPLLQTCIPIWRESGRNADDLKRRLNDLKRQGIKVNEHLGLMEAVNNVEMRLFHKDLY